MLGSRGQVLDESDTVFPREFARRGRGQLAEIAQQVRFVRVASLERQPGL